MMLRIIEGLPPQVLAIEAVGEVTHEDYRDVLIPRAEAMIVRGPISMMYVVGADFKNFDLEALWDDGAFGIKHWRDFSHVAVVTDIGWLRSAAGIFAPLIPADVRLFRLSELPAAKDWIATDTTTAAPM
jgi:hypothetical protein